ncbi:MAG: SUMF1/EgtB/PvdO family nonheme iron enzyme [Sulfuritalea sp.]|nr:SUMF1/EgtB/PvdO family nonheme iron enzyme [Sulfuritalea sp.]
MVTKMTWLALALFCVLAPAHAARLALVIGNDGYQYVDRLRNARNDARAMAETLTAAGFKVTRQFDTDRETLFKTVDSFALGVKKEDEVVFFFSGHGVQLGSEPYLLPVNIGADSERQVSRDGLKLDQVAGDLAKARYALLIIDACRDNPFPRQGTKSIGRERGLIPVEAPEGMTILMAAGRGQKALDRLSTGDPDPNGLFTRELLRRMKTPGLPVSDLLKGVRDDVERKAGSVNHKQRPALVDESRGTFYFFPPGADTQVASLTAVATDPLAVELAFWNSVKDSRDAGEIKLYLEKYPRGQFAALARARVKSLEAVPVAPAAAPAPAAPTAGQRIQDCAECPELVVIPAGSFSMGSNDGGIDEKPVHTVRIGNGFALGKTEVTQGQWWALMGSNPSGFASCGDACPVEKVSWDDAQAYVRKLSEKTGKRYRLPSEAEWEYACRAGGTQTYCGSDSVDSVAWYGAYATPVGNSGKTTNPVGKKQANRWGLYDMSGNVYEWVEDCYHDSYSGAPSDGSARTSGCSDSVRRVLRGGSWFDIPQVARSAGRSRYARVDRNVYGGFRVARMLP